MVATADLGKQHELGARGMDYPVGYSLDPLASTDKVLPQAPAAKNKALWDASTYSPRQAQEGSQ